MPGQGLGFRSLIPRARGMLDCAPPQLFGLTGSTGIDPHIGEHAECGRQPAASSSARQAAIQAWIAALTARYVTRDIEEST